MYQDWKNLVEHMGGTVVKESVAASAPSSDAKKKYDAQIVQLGAGGGDSAREDAKLVGKCDAEYRVLTFEWLIQCVLHGARAVYDAFLVYDPDQHRELVRKHLAQQQQQQQQPQLATPKSSSAAAAAAVSSTAASGAKRSSLKRTLSGGRSSAGSQGSLGNDEKAGTVPFAVALALVEKRKKSLHKVKINLAWTLSGATGGGASFAPNRIGTFDSDNPALAAMNMVRSRFEVGDFVSYLPETTSSSASASLPMSPVLHAKKNDLRYGKIVAFPETASLDGDVHNSVGEDRYDPRNCC